MFLEHNVRTYGQAPYKVAVLHGGPGAPGTMAPVAREISSDMGVLEPLQTATSVDGQVQELKAQLEANADLPVILIGSSWGAWLSYIFAARYPRFASKIILVGSGGFKEEYAEKILETRLNRLSSAEREEALGLIEALDGAMVQDKNSLMARLGDLFSKTDSYNHLTLDTEAIECGYDVYEKVWREAADLRRSGELLEAGKLIRCPVVAIHGDYDPHPAEGVEKPLSTILGDFRFVLLKNCGHEPWLEKEAGDQFFEIVRAELMQH